VVARNARFSPKKHSYGAAGGTDMIQMHAAAVTETQGESSHFSTMSVLTSIAVSNIKACAERLAASANRLAHDPRADLAAERTKQTITAVEFKANLGILKIPSAKAKAILDIVA
jgi:hypothetical protein